MMIRNTGGMTSTAPMSPVDEPLQATSAKNTGTERIGAQVFDRMLTPAKAGAQAERAAFLQTAMRTNGITGFGAAALGENVKVRQFRPAGDVSKPVLSSVNDQENTN